MARATSGLGRYKSAESKANSEANLKLGSAKPGEVRRKPLSHGLATAQEHRAEIQAQIDARLGDVPMSSSVRTAADISAQVRVQVERQNASIERAVSLTSQQAEKKLAQQTKLLNLQIEANNGLERAIEACLSAARGLHDGQPIAVPDDDARAIAVARILMSVGAIAGSSPEAIQKARDLSAQLHRDEQDRAAREAELADLPTTTTTKPKPKEAT